MDSVDEVVAGVRDDGQPVTTSDLCARLPDVSQANVYRQVALLAAGGLVELEREERVRGPRSGRTVSDRRGPR